MNDEYINIIYLNENQIFKLLKILKDKFNIKPEINSIKINSLNNEEDLKKKIQLQ